VCLCVADGVGTVVRAGHHAHGSGGEWKGRQTNTGCAVSVPRENIIACGVRFKQLNVIEGT
jgi:hypothetical protein